MRSGARWLIAGIWLFGCAGDYPLPPTACDEYCHATKDMQCAFYEPASCVSQCERERKGDAACDVQLAALLSCFESTGAADKRCNAYASYPFNNVDAVLCDGEINELQSCSNTLRISGEQG